MPQNTDFTATTAYPLFLRSYSRTSATGAKETAQEAKDRAIKGLQDFGLLTDKELELVREYFYKNIVFVSGRWFWIGGTDWVKQQKNFIGAYNCASVPVDSWKAFRFNFRALLMGCGVGTVVEEHIISQLPEINYSIEVKEVVELGSQWNENNIFESSNYTCSLDSDSKALVIKYKVGDSKEGWVDIATDLLKFASFDFSYNFENVKYEKIHLYIDLSEVRPAGKILKGFGGLSNPERLEEGLKNIIKILNTSVGRKLNSLEICKILAIHGVIAVSGNIRRSARINQGTPSDKFFSESKDNLWVQDDQGNWKIDPDRDMLRFGNHTLCYHNKPDLETIIEAVRKQYYSGEGAIQYVPEAIARGNVDLLNTSEKKLEFIALYCQSRRDGSNYLLSLKEMDNKELEHRMQRYSANPCLIGDTLIATANGLVPIQDLAGKTFETSVDLRTIGLSGVIQTQAIAFSTGVKAIYEVKLANGLSVKSTSNHQHFTDKGWVETKNLTSEHKVLFQQGEGKWGEDSKNNINSEQSQMLGWWYGDGYNVKMKSRSKNRAEYLAKGFVFNPKEYLTAGTTVLYALETITEHRYIPRLHKGVYEFKSCSLKLSDWFDRLNVQTKEELPVSFFQERRETIIGFLQGLFSADGSVGNINKAVARQALLVNKSKKFIEQIQILLLNLGIISSTRCAVKSGAKGVPYTLKDGTKKISNNNGSYTLSIFAESFNRFVEIIGFPLCPLKQEQADLWVEKPLINYLEETVNKRYSSNVVSVKEVGEETVYDLHVPLTNSFIANGIVTHNCFEVLGEKFLCNLSQVHLNNLDPNNELEQVEAFKASTLAALPLLSHEFDIEDFKYSREIDPIIGISFTGLFDFFVNKFGADWLLWWKTGRSKDSSEAQYFLDTERYYLELWKNSVRETVEEYCKRHSIKQPNRYTVVQPSGSVSLLTNASAGWHAPKATRYIRRITFSSNSPIVSASKDYGYNIVPSQSCKDENGNLLNDINDPRVNEVLIEIPVEVSWASIADKADYNPSENTVLAQLDFFMQVQKYYATHTVSATIELTEAEIEPLGTAIYNLIQNDEGYISAALLAKFDSLETFPRLPFEPITHEKYLEEMQAVKNRQISTDFVTLVNQYSKGFDFVAESGSTGCDSDKCLMPEKSK